MKKHKIPKGNKDLRFYAAMRNFKRIFFYALIVIVMNIAMVSYLDGRIAGLPPIKWWGYLIFELVVLVVGWIACNMSAFVSDKYAFGKMKTIKTVRSYGRLLSRRGKLDVGYYNYFKASVIGRNGRRTVRIQLFEDGYDGYYREGGTILKFRGLNYPLCLESEAEGVHICSVCGVRRFDKDAEMSSEAVPTCEVCNHTLIDAKAFFEENE